MHLTKGRYAARLATSAADVERAQALRGDCFLGGGRDQDAFDSVCDHVLVENRQHGELVCCFRFLPLEAGRDIARSYSAQFYDLAALGAFRGRMLEMGRFCIHPDRHDPDILRVAWGAMTAYVDAHGVEMLFGCASFAGTDPRAHGDAFAVLQARHLAPDRWQPRVKALQVARFPPLQKGRTDLKTAMASIPPLLRTYLALGGWVSDHAVVDNRLNTLHVFTAVEIAGIPPARKRFFRGLAG